MHFHGGGWLTGSIEMSDDACRFLANRSGCVVMSAAYRFAPEHPFPAAADDAYAAFEWAAAHADDYGSDGTRVAVLGTSAGADLAAAICLRAVDTHGQLPVMQVLAYPPLDATFRSQSFVDNATGYYLTADQMRWFWSKYVGQSSPDHPYLSPLYAADLRGQPPAVIITAEFDPLRDDGERYAERLTRRRCRSRIAPCRGSDPQLHGAHRHRARGPRMLDARRHAAAIGADVIALPVLGRDSLLFLHGDDGPLAAQPFVDALRAGVTLDAEVVAPTCPGWSQEPIPVWLRTVDQLAYHYLDALDRSATAPVIAIGASMGAWLLLEMATKQPQLFSALVLISPVGVKVTDRETAQFTDLFARDIAARASVLYADPESALRRLALHDDHEILGLAVAQEAIARFGWEPYLYNPLLRHRLHRVTSPTAIFHGSDDAFVANLDYYRRVAALLGGPTQLIAIEGAGHRVEEEQPTALARSVLEFLRDVR